LEAESEAKLEADFFGGDKVGGEVGVVGDVGGEVGGTGGGEVGGGGEGGVGGCGAGVAHCSKKCF
jgi:hypothetical protein